MIFYYIECIFEIFCHIVYAFWEKNSVRSCLHISYQKRVGGFHCVWFCTLFFPLAITVFLFCNKSCCWRGRKTQHKWVSSCSLPESTQVLWREETWQGPMKSIAEFLLIGVRPGFHSAPWWRHLVPLKDSHLQNVKLACRKFTHLVVIFHKTFEKRTITSWCCSKAIKAKKELDKKASLQKAATPKQLVGCRPWSEIAAGDTRFVEKGTGISGTLCEYWGLASWMS